MNTYHWEENLVDTRVTYTLEVNGQLIIIENVPARVNVEPVNSCFHRRQWNACSEWSGNEPRPNA